MNEKKFKIAPIGYIRIEKGTFCLEIEREYIPALKELETFSYVNVL